MENKIFWLEEHFIWPQFYDRERPVVLVARGRKNKDRFLFDLRQVTVVYLNYSPPQWAYDYYRENYPDEIDRSLFSFIHGAHRNVHFPRIQSPVNIITWRGMNLYVPLYSESWDVSDFNDFQRKNTSVAALFWFSHVTWKKYPIYLSAFDMDRDKDWSQEVESMKKIMDEYQRYGREYAFLTPNRFFTERELLSIPSFIKKKLSDEEIRQKYGRSGQPIPEFIHPGT